MKKLYAFWKYDFYPYLLGGQVTNILDNGSVETEEYGKGRYFSHIIKILPLKAGADLKEKLKKLEMDREKALHALYAEWDKKLEDVLGFDVRKK